MKAACVDRYGPPEVIVVRDMPMPEVGAKDVLIRQRASNVSPADLASRSGNPFLIRFFMGLTKPSQPIPGGAVAGTVESVGHAITAFKPGATACSARQIRRRGLWRSLSSSRKTGH